MTHVSPAGYPYSLLCYPEIDLEWDVTQHQIPLGQGLVNRAPDALVVAAFTAASWDELNRL